MQELNVAISLLAGSAVVLGLLSNSLKRWGLPDSVVLLSLGVVCGPLGLAWLEPANWGKPMKILEEAARLALAIGLMDIALRLPRSFIFKHWRSLALLLIVGMLFMWIASSVIVGSLFGLSLGALLLVGAAITPTDPVVASAVVTGPVAEEKLPSNLRWLISAESGANDGLAYLFVFVGILMLTLPPQESLGLNVLMVLLGDIGVALIAGLVIGFAAGKVLRLAERRGMAENSSMLMFTTALALFTLASVKLIGSDGILAVFVAGLAFDQQVGVQERHREEQVVGGMDRFFTSPVFVLLGLMLPWNEWLALGWQGVAAVLGVLLLRRLPLFLLFGRHLWDLPRFKDCLFAGWFGPLGVAALYYATMAHHKTGLEILWPLVSLLTVASIVAHGLSATPLTRLYGRGERGNGGNA